VIASRYFEEWRVRIARFAKLSQRISVPLRPRQQPLLRYLKAGDVCETQVNRAGTSRIRAARHRQLSIVKFLRRRSKVIRLAGAIVELKRAVRRSNKRREARGV